MGKVLAVCVSEIRGIQKKDISKVELIENYGLKNDAHAGTWHRQVSLLAIEKIEEFEKRGIELEHGAFGENFVVSGVDLVKLPIGTRLKIGEAEIEVTQIGKQCHSRCHIYDTVGDCIMPREGIFAKVIKGGMVKVDDKVEVI